MMKKILNKKILLGAIILLALVFRLNALSHGLENTPIPLFASEATPINTALRMIENKTLNVGIGENNYQPLLIYVNIVIYTVIFFFKILFGIFKDLNEVKEFLIINRSEIILISRIIVAGFGVASVYGLYRVGKKMFNETVGLIAAFFFSVELLHITISHIASVWVPMLLFLIFAFYEAVDIYKIGSWRAYILSAFFASLAFGTHLVGGISITPLIAAHFLRQDKIVSKKSFFNKKFIFAILIFSAFVIFFILLNPIPLFGELINNNIANETGFQTAYNNYYDFFYYTFKFIFEYQPILSILAALGIVALIFEKRYKELILISFLPFLYYIYINLIVFSYQARLFIIFIPFTLLLSAYFIYKLSRIAKVKSGFVLFAIVIIAALPSIYITERWSSVVRNESNEELFQEWVYESINDGSKILINHTSGQFFLEQNKEYIMFYKNTFGEDNLTERQKFLLDYFPKKYIPIAYFPLKVNLVPRDKLEQIFKNYKFDYYVEIYLDGKTPIRELMPVLKDAELIKQFKPDYTIKILQDNIITSLYHPFRTVTNIGKNYGSVINVYKLKNN